MKKTCAGGLYRPVAFLLLAALLILTLGVTLDGRKRADASEDIPEKMSPSPTSELRDTVPTYVEPLFLSPLTGLESTEDRQGRIPIGFLVDPTLGTYGASNAAVTVEFPIEGGQTRLLLLTEDPSSLGKIGSIAPSRKYMTDFFSSFGMILVARGEDDTVSYASCETEISALDVSKTDGHSYTEGSAVYTNGYLVASGIEDAGFPTESRTAPCLPFSFGEAAFDASNSPATRISLPYSQSNTRVLTYHESTGCYTLGTDEEDVTDALSGTTPSYKNVFVLFADSTTYEKSDRTEMVLDTAAGGVGYYLVNGRYEKILWRTEGGVTVFYDKAGEKLICAPGSSYVALFKSSQKLKVRLFEKG